MCQQQEEFMLSKIYDRVWTDKSTWRVAGGFVDIQCSMHILRRDSKDFFLAMTCCPCVVWSRLLYLTVLQWLHCNMLGNCSIATDVWMCRSTACIVEPDNHTTIAVDKAQCDCLIRTTGANTAILKLYIILWITLLTPRCSNIFTSCIHIWLHQQWISCTQL